VKKITFYAVKTHYANNSKVGGYINVDQSNWWLQKKIKSVVKAALLRII